MNDRKGKRLKDQRDQSLPRPHHVHPFILLRLFELQAQLEVSVGGLISFVTSQRTLHASVGGRLIGSRRALKSRALNCRSADHHKSMKFPLLLNMTEGYQTRIQTASTVTIGLEYVAHHGGRPIFQFSL